MIESAPTTLNPRLAIDAYSQRLNGLMLRALTRLDANLEPQPDLAASWSIEEGGRLVRFRLREDLRDQAGETITAEKMAACLDSYRLGKPVSPFRGAFPHWASTGVDGPAVVVRMEKPDPYFFRNLVLLRYFRVAGDARPCADPGPDGRLVGSGPYRAESPELAPETGITLVPMADPQAPWLRYEFVRDDNTKLLKLLRGEVDFVQNAISLAKTRWVKENASDRFRVLERGGITVSYLAFNLRDPLLARREVRQAIALAIPREAIVHGRLGEFGDIAGSLLSPSLEESDQSAFRYDPVAAERLLDEAGLPRDADGVRLRFRYKSTPVREGIETALIMQSELRKIGIELTLDVVEPAVFFASIRNHVFQLYSSRWIGVADGSLLYKTLHTGELDNRVGYSNPEMDRWLEAAAAELDLTRRASLMRNVQRRMAADLPYLPLWYWNNALILRKDLGGVDATSISRSGAFEPLTAIRFR